MKLTAVADSDIKVTIIRTYFKGHYYLIEADFEGNSVFFESNIEYKKNISVYLKRIE